MDKRELINRDKRDAQLINIISDYAIENQMSLKEIDKCIEKVTEIYYSTGLIVRG